MNKTPLNIGLFGLGVVGSGLVQVLETAGLPNTNIKKICVRTPGKPRPVAPEKLTLNPMEILDDPNINVVVETISHAENAFQLVSEAMRRGKHVITANKKMVADNLHELIELQQLTGSTLLYESAACAAIPIVRTLESHFAAEPLKRISGIFNGTSNYILSRMNGQKLDFQEALSQAQALGFAEQDPSSDIDGDDAKYKLILLAAHSHGIIVRPEAVLNFGIRHIRRSDIEFAGKHNCRIKLLPVCKRIERNKLMMFVMPAMVSESHALFDVEEEFNGIELETGYSGTQFYRGRGAGSQPTGSAILSDLLALQNGYRYRYLKHNQNGSTVLDAEQPLRVYLRAPHGFPLKQLAFVHIEQKGETPDGSYVIGVTNLNTLRLNAGLLTGNGIFAMRYDF
jgi:homoserine dehydrogenase